MGQFHRRDVTPEDPQKCRFLTLDRVLPTVFPCNFFFFTSWEDRGKVVGREIFGKLARLSFIISKESQYIED